jgi:hypothetical protein
MRRRRYLYQKPLFTRFLPAMLAFCPLFKVIEPFLNHL